MSFVIEAACSCHMGKIRKNNEDNFYFDGKCLEVENNGLKNPAYIDVPVKRGLCFAVFDGMGGENFGEIASFAAAHQMQQAERTLGDYLISEKRYLNRLSISLNEAVLQAKREQCTDRMGTTMVALYFSGRYVYACNIGDSRAYRLRDGEFLQISEDHVESRPGRERKKAPLTQHLGIDPEDMVIEPYIAKGDLRKGDMYLLCSDGLTDMLSNLEISCLMHDSTCVDECAAQL
ncbi:MAG: serine/threonine-protein phosphatase, partial [Fibrobacter sp.]|nr:serine/threonine-protein phosphatase [Fibrobacter sp.]